jgi:hypothetical protein
MANERDKSKRVTAPPHTRIRTVLLVTLASLMLGLGLLATLSRQSMLGPALAQGSTTISLEPPNATIQGCETISVGIWITDVADLYGADVRLSFDATVLEVVDADSGKSGVQLEHGNLLTDTDSLRFVVRNRAENITGTIEYAVTQLNPAEPVTGSGVLAIIWLRGSGTGTSDLDFTYHKLANRDGETITSSTATGTVTTTAPGSPTLSISRLNTTTAQLSWSSVSGIAVYELYRDTDPYFTPSDPAHHSTTSLSYNDAGALGDTSTNYYYALRSACENGFQSANSNRVGEFDFELQETTASDFNWVALPLDASLSTASDLATHIDDNSSAELTAQAVEEWNATGQNYQTYSPVPHPTGDFDLRVGNPYRIAVDVTTGTTAIWTLTGAVPDQSVFTYTLEETTESDHNWIMLPLQKDTITLASHLLTDIETDASPAVTVMAVEEWNAIGQNYETYVTLPKPSGDFLTHIGYPYRVTVDVDSGTTSTWP